MKIILIKDVEKLGKVGEVKDVAAGYFKNYLFRNNLAINYTEKVYKTQQEIIQRAVIKKEKQIKRLQEELTKLGKIEIKRNAGPEGRLFGSVTSANIKEELKKYNIEIKKDAILFEEVRHLGEYKIDIKLTNEIIVNLELSILEEK